MREGELVVMCQRINLLVKYENFILSLTKKLNCFKSIMTINVCPDTLTDGKIMIEPNKTDKILVRKKTRLIQATRTETGVGGLVLQPLNGRADAENMPNSNVQKMFKKLKMDPEIIREVHSVLKKRSAKSDTDRLQNIESQLKKLLNR